MTGDEYEGPAEAAAGPGPSWAPRAASGGNMPVLGSQHVLAARPPVPRQFRTPLAGGARPAETPTFGQMKPDLAGGPNVAPSFHWNDYRADAPAPHLASVSAPGPTPIEPPDYTSSLEQLMAARQQQGGGMQMPQFGESAAEGEAGEAGAAAEGAEAAGGEAAAGGAATLVEALGFL